jgi:hypothetical protein
VSHHQSQGSLHIHYIKLIHSVFNILPVFTCWLEMHTYVQTTFLQYGCLCKLWSTLGHIVDELYLDQLLHNNNAVWNLQIHYLYSEAHHTYKISFLHVQLYIYTVYSGGYTSFINKSYLCISGIWISVNGNRTIVQVRQKSSDRCRKESIC